MPSSSSHSRCDVEGQAVLEDRPRAVLRGSAAWVAAKASLRVPPERCASPTVRCMVSRKSRVCSMAASTASRPWAMAPRPPTSCRGAESLDPVEGAGGPVEVERVAGVEGGLGLDQVAGEEDLLLGQPGDDVALGVAAPEELQHQLAAVTAQLDGEPVAERQVGPGQAGDGVGLLEQPRHPADTRSPSPAVRAPRSGAWSARS